MRILAFQIEYSRFILGAARMRRTLYLVVFALLVATLAFGGYYYRHRAARPSPPAAAAPCDTPAVPPPPKTPPPKVPDFSVEPGCGTPGSAAKPAGGPAQKK
jgi:hypothetical protein